MNNDEMKRHIAAKIESGEIGPRLAFQRAMPDDYEIHFRARGGHYFWRLRGVDGIRSAITDPMEVIKHAWLHLLSGQKSAGMSLASEPVALRADDPRFSGEEGWSAAARSNSSETPNSSFPRLDFSKPPPGYGPVENWVGKQIREHETAEEQRLTGWTRAITAMRAHHKARRDPPGMRVFDHVLPIEFGGDGKTTEWLWGVVAEDGTGCSRSPAFDSEAEARPATWTHYVDALEVADLLDEHVSVLEHDDDGNVHRVETTVSGLFDAVAPMLFFTFGPDEYERAEIQAVVDELLARGKATFEGDAPIELVRFNVWPRALTWTAQQRAEVRRWATWGKAKQKVSRPPALPEVLRGL